MNEHLKISGKGFLGSLILTSLPCGIRNKRGVALLLSILISLELLFFMCCRYSLYSPAERTDIFSKPLTYSVA